ncbi:hypothetical protein [Candidatus Pelagibacter sp. HIMB1782]|uniref:hypothetical protein n=1 Tax=Candidatus Pelagibacter sp. HIMB1782 TaxID=3413375 RepID=UPI003F87936F
MIKKLLPIIIILFLSTSCGFEPKYKGFDGVDFILKLQNSSGDRDLNNAIKSQLSRYANGKDDYNIIKLDLDSKFEKISISKNSKGEITKYNLRAEVSLKITSDKEERDIFFIEEFKIDKISDTVEEKNYIQIIKKDFAQSIVRRLILNLRKNK